MSDFLAKEAERDRQLFEQLGCSRVVDVTGIVDGFGVSAAKSRGEFLWTLLIGLVAWRVDSGPLRTNPITVRRKIRRQEIQAYRDRIQPETVIRIHARVAEDNLFGTPQALLEELLEADSSDTELHEYLAELQKPITHEDESFGTLTFDRKFKTFEGSAEWSGASIRLELSPQPSDDIQTVLEVARVLWNDQDRWAERVRDYAVQELLPIKNAHWLDEGESELDADQFKNRMTLNWIQVSADGRFVFWHDDGELFFGHSIQVSGNLSDGPTDADIPG